MLTALPKSKKKLSVANAIVCGKFLLLLKRHPLDAFHGGTWCLPGGGVDLNEKTLDACYRETFEETGLTAEDFTPVTTWTVDLDDIKIVYYYSTFTNIARMKGVILDNTEHSNYIWAEPQAWFQMDLILDLKQHLIDAMV